jgi:hypothetical protein
VEDPLSEKLLRGQIKSKDHVLITVDGDELRFEVSGRPSADDSEETEPAGNAS